MSHTDQDMIKTFEESIAVTSTFIPRASGLFVGRKTTHLYRKLVESTTGAAITKRGGGFSDHDLLTRLTRLGWVEDQRTGPRGGKRWHITQLGKHILDCANDHIATLKHKTEMDMVTNPALDTLREDIPTINRLTGKPMKK